MKKRRRKKAPLAPVACRGEIIQEALPLPFVHYPKLYGTFLVFSEAENGILCFCACAEDPLRNLLRLLALQELSRNANPLRTAPLPTPYVPDRIAQASLSHRGNPLQDAAFRPGLCHRCNCTAPALRWCHEMYGGPFEQHYGWYIRQTYLRFGIDAMRMVFLDDVCPVEYQSTIKEVKQVRDSFQEERTRLYTLEHSPPRVDIHRAEELCRYNVRMSEAKTMIALQKQYASLRTALLGSIDSITRQEFGVDKWVSETVLYQIVCRIVHPDCVLRHFRPEWLGGLELDIYIPDRRLAIEYQGQQHFHPVEVWGGNEGLEALQARDEKKAKTCKQHGVCLITFDYKESLTEDHVRNVLAESLIRSARQARTSADLPQLKKLFKGTGINLPPVPEGFAKRLTERGRWCLSTRVVRLSPYDFDSYVQKARGKRVANYLVIAHDGHGVNSYAWHYYLVDGALRVLLQLGWGGVYGNRKEETEEINQCFQLVAQIVATVPDAVRRGRLGKKERVLVAASNFYGSFWEKSDEGGLFAQSDIREMVDATARILSGSMEYRQPVELLTEVLNWLYSSTRFTHAVPP